MSHPESSNPGSSPRKRTRGDSGDKEHKDSFRPAKKAKPEKPFVATKQHPKGRASLLLGENIPFDIQVEVFSYLPPDQLLRLARVTKHLRAILMSKAARSVWIISLSALPPYAWLRFPPCPPDLSEPQYASLLFDSECLHCGKDADQPVDFGSRERLCEKCHRRKQNRISRRGTLANFARVCGIAEEQAHELEAIFALVPRSHSSGLFCPQVALGIYQQCVAQKARLGQAEYRTYLQKRAEVMDAVKKHGQEVAAWHVAYLMQREPDVKVKRCNKIEAKLSELGWSHEDFPSAGQPNYALWKKLVISKKPLNGEAWVAIKPRLEEMLSAQRASRIAARPTHMLVGGQWIIK